MKNLNPLFGLLLFSGILSAQGNVDYNDVAVIINDNSQVSQNIGDYFQAQRDIPDQNIIHIATTTEDEIDSLEFEQIRQQIETYLIDNSLTDIINYMVTTKGVPLRVKRGSCSFPAPMSCASVDSELSLILGNYSGDIANTMGFNNPYYDSGTHFELADFDIYLVTRLDGYTEEDVINLIDRSGPNIPVNQLTSKLIFDISFTSGYDLDYFTSIMEDIIDNVSSNGWGTTFHPDSSLLTDQQNVFGYYSLNHQPKDKILNNTWVAGSIAELTRGGSAYTFDALNNVNNELIVANLIAEGATGAHGNAYNNFFSTSLNVNNLFNYYTDTTSHYNLAESFYMSIPKLSWVDIIIGDPKTSIFIDNTVPIAALTPGNPMSIYPNPSNGNFIVEATDLPLHSIKILNQLGQEIHVQKNELDSSTILINLSNEGVGIYFIQFQADNGFVTEKIMVTK